MITWGCPRLGLAVEAANVQTPDSESPGTMTKCVSHFDLPPQEFRPRPLVDTG